MLTWMQRAIIAPTRKLTQSDLDYLFDKEANSIGGLMLHLAATETYYQRHTFNGEAWGKWPADISAKWDAAMRLGDAGRATIKGHNLAFYTDALNEVRERSLAESRKRDDAWLMTVDKEWPWVPRTTTVSGSMSASTSPTTRARSTFFSSACLATNPTPNAWA